MFLVFKSIFLPRVIIRIKNKISSLYITASFDYSHRQKHFQTLITLLMLKSNIYFLIFI